MRAPLDSRFLPWTQSALRIVAGLAYWSHGVQKLFGWLGGVDGHGGTVAFMSFYGAAGVIETVFGALIVLGLFTRVAAYVASGEMAVAYLWVHAMGGGLFWWQNRGELPMLYCFIFLAFAAWGAGPVSFDARRARE